VRVLLLTVLIASLEGCSLVPKPIHENLCKEINNGFCKDQVVPTSP
jgi:hypothetical protein